MSERAAPLIVHVIFRLDYGGLENGLVNLLNRLPPTRFRHAIVCLAGFSDFSKRLQRNDIALYSLDKRPGKDLRAYWRFWRLMRKLRPAVVHTRNLGTIDLQWVAWAAGVPARVHGEHGWGADDPRGVKPRTLSIRRACRFVIQRYVAVSQDLREWLKASVRVIPERITQIYNGVDTTRFVSGDARAADSPWRAGEHFVFGTIGRLDPIKNQRMLLEAFAQCVRQAGREHLRLIVVGDGPLAAPLRARSEELGIADLVWFTGARNDIPELLRAMNVFVLPSINEGISNTILEAMAAGRPVIAGRVGGNGELIESGRTGVLYAADDANALVAAMLDFSDDPRRVDTMGQAARARAVNEFGVQAMVDRYAAVYEQLSFGRG